MNQHTTLPWAICVGLCVCTAGACGLAGDPHLADSQNVRLNSDQVVELLLEMQYAYAAQRSMLKTMQLNATVVRPQNGQTQDSRACLTKGIGTLPGTKLLCQLVFSGDSQGHFLQKIQTFHLPPQVDPYTCVSQESPVDSLMFSFDGRQARILSQGQGFVYDRMEQVPNVGHYDPHEAMPHLFHPTVTRMLDHPDQVDAVRLPSDLWLLTFQDNHKLYQFWVIPQQDFVMVKLTRQSVADYFPVTEWEQGIQYSQTATGFWYPTRSYTKAHERVTQLTRIDAFVLNPPPVSYCLGFAEETPVYRHPSQTMDLSFQGQGRILQHAPGMARAAQVIAGHVQDVNGSPVTGAAVQVCGDSHLDDYDSVLWHYPRDEEQRLTYTDKAGRFSLRLDVEKAYHVLVYDARFAPTLIRNVPAGTGDLTVHLSPGGVISGRVVYCQEDARIPVPHVEIRAVQIDPRPMPLMRLDCDRIVLTDAQGRFQFDRLLVRIMDYRIDPSPRWDSQSHKWEIGCLDNLTAITLSSQNNAADLELVVKPQVREMFTHNTVP